MIGKYFLLLATIGAVTAVQQVPVTIYYETLCADSMNFFTKQFMPTYRDLKQYLRVDLVPWGKSEIIPPPVPGLNQTIKCHHGAEECIGNKFAACLLESINQYPMEDKLELMNCLLSDTTSPVSRPYQERINACRNKAGRIDVSLIESCAVSQNGEEKILPYQRKTWSLLNGALTSVPTIVFERYDSAASKEAENSFRGALCKRITENPKPKACEGSGAPITTAGLITLLTAGLFVRML